MALHLKSRRQCPPNGFQYTQRESGWHLQTWDFELLCQELLKHRQANPKFRLSMDIAVIREEVDVANARRVAAMGVDAESYLSEQPSAGDFPKTMPPQRQPSRSVAAVVSRLQSGYDLQKEWKESGEPPVDSKESERRAQICVECPMNGTGGLTRFFTLPIANQIKKQMEDFHKMNLRTTVDERLGVCEACICPMRLKVHTPLGLILKHTKPEVRADLHHNCWIPNPNQ